MKQFQRVAVEEYDKTRVDILAAVSGKKIIVLMNELIGGAWEQAVAAGQVSDRMLQMDAHHAVAIAENPHPVRAQPVPLVFISKGVKDG